MRRVLLSLVALAAALTPVAAFADVGVTNSFTNLSNLSSTCPNPEGIAVDPTGNLYAASFPLFLPHTSANICVVDASGMVTRIIPVAPGAAAGVTNLLGELFVPGEGLMVVDFADGQPGHGRLLQVDAGSGRVTQLASGFQAPNAIVQDRHRDTFVSDSFKGVIWKVTPSGAVSIWASSPLLVPNGNPPFGANGLAFDRDQQNLFVANTSTDSIIEFPVKADGSAGMPAVFARGVQGTGVLDGADGIMFDVQGNLWVCANQANEVQVLSPDAKVIARYGGAGSNALDFPASLVFRGRTLFVTDLALTTPADSRLSVMSTPLPGEPLRP